MYLNPRKKDSIPFIDLSSTSEEEKKPDLNPIYSDSNPGIWRCEEHMKDSNTRKMDLNPIQRMKHQVEGFKSLSYGFESPLVHNSNFTKKIRILEFQI